MVRRKEIRVNADQRMAALQVELDAAFKKHTDKLPKSADLASWGVTRASAYAEQTGRLLYELGKAYREIDALQAAAKLLQSKLDGTAGYSDFDLTEPQPTTGTLDGAPCLLDRDEHGAVACVYIAGHWVEPYFFSDRAHAAWDQQRQEAAQAIAEEVAA